MPPDEEFKEPAPQRTRLEMAREVEALRLAVRERESWLDELRLELEERDASLGWRDQEAKNAVAEAAGARREAAQFREDRDHVRHQLHAKNEEGEAALARLAKFEAEVKELRIERRRRLEELVELRAQLDVGGGDQTADPQLFEERKGREAAEEREAQVRLELRQANDTLRGLADEMAALKDEVSTEAAAAAAGRIREIELLQRISAQGDELAAARAELEELRAALAEEQRAESRRREPSKLSD